MRDELERAVALIVFLVWVFGFGFVWFLVLVSGWCVFDEGFVVFVSSCLSLLS